MIEKRSRVSSLQAVLKEQEESFTTTNAQTQSTRLVMPTVARTRVEIYLMRALDGQRCMRGILGDGLSFGGFRPWIPKACIIANANRSVSWLTDSAKADVAVLKYSNEDNEREGQGHENRI